MATPFSFIRIAQIAMMKLAGKHDNVMGCYAVQLEALKCQTWSCMFFPVTRFGTLEHNFGDPGIPGVPNRRQWGTILDLFLEFRWI